MSKDYKVSHAMGLMSILNLIGRGSGLVREMIFAKYFGASLVTDAYLIATNVPNFIYGVVGSALSYTMVPAYTQAESHGGREEASRVASSMINLSGLLLIVVTILGLGFGPWITKVIAPGFSPEGLTLAVELFNIGFFMVIFACLGAMVSGILNANYVFGITSFAPVATNIIIILVTIFFGKKYGIQGVTYGTVFGWLAFFAVQIPALFKTGYKYSLSIDIKHPAVIKTIKVSIPFMISIAAYQTYFLIDRLLASGLPEGSIASLNYANKVVQLVSSVFVTAIASAVFPLLASQKASGHLEKFRNTLVSTLKKILLLTMPVIVILWVMGTPIIELMFKRGVFDDRAVQMTVFALGFYTFGLLAHSWNMILLRAFTAFDDTISTAIYAVITIVINIALSYILRNYLAHGGLALANSIAATVNTALLMWTMSRHSGGISGKNLALCFAKTAFAAGIMAIVLNVFIYVWPRYLTVWLEVPVGITLGLFVYGVFAYLLKVDEALNIYSTIHRKFFAITGETK